MMMIISSIKLSVGRVVVGAARPMRPCGGGGRGGKGGPCRIGGRMGTAETSANTAETSANTRLGSGAGHGRRVMGERPRVATIGKALIFN